VATSLAAVPALPVLQAVAVFDGAPVSVPGVRTVAPLTSLHMAVVRGDVRALSRLAAAPGVRALDPDAAVELTGNDLAGLGDAVLASEGLGGTAGRAGAGAGARVAVVDTGVSDTAALDRASGRLVDAVDTSAVTDGGDVRTSGTFADGFGHGTFMAGVVAGGPVDGTDGKALGVAPGATVLVVKVAKADGSTSLGSVLAGLEWVAEHADQVDVASIALSMRRPTPHYVNDPLTAAVKEIRAAGVAPVVAAGNKAGQVGDPGFSPQAITVGAADLDTRRVAVFSGSAKVAGIRKPDVVASGVHVLGVLPTGSVLEQDDATRHLPHGLFRATGTSQATAAAAGVAALVVADHPSATPAQVKASLRCAADNLSGKRDGAGLVQAPQQLCSGPDGQGLQGEGDLTGEADFDASSWGASSWGASSWGASSWGASSWGASSWGASSWAASSWAASSWAASSWAASSWAASSWAASSWAASSWAASSWACSSWGDGS
jgi:serine protease AprX